MKDIASNDAVRDPIVVAQLEQDVRAHAAFLGHDKLGVTELRIFDFLPQVAYPDNADAVVRLCREMDGKTSGIHVGVQPRPAHLFDLAPNRWVPARGGRDGNCARDGDIEYVTAVFFDIDVVSPERAGGQTVGAVRDKVQWSRYVADLIRRVQGSVRRFHDPSKLRFLLYPDGLTPSDVAAIRRDDIGIVWLGKKQ